MADVEFFRLIYYCQHPSIVHILRISLKTFPSNIMIEKVPIRYLCIPCKAKFVLACFFFSYKYGALTGKLTHHNHRFHFYLFFSIIFVLIKNQSRIRTLQVEIEWFRFAWKSLKRMWKTALSIVCIKQT